MNILIVGSGAREHALVKALKRSQKNPTIFCCGTHTNPGILPNVKNYWIGNICETDAVLKQALKWNIDIAFIGPEAPLAEGLADALWDNGIATIGPKKKLAQIETSKSFARDLLKKYAIPGLPDYRVFQNEEGVLDFLHHLGEGNYVVKANGLMGGKGVKVAGDHLHSISEAYQFCKELVESGESFIIEEKFIGQEFSFMCFCDGNILIPMPLIQDHKRAFIHDEGPNTGGMGSYSMADHSMPFLTQKDLDEANHINQSLLTALTAEFHERYIGILYGSFIATKNGVGLIEYNARFGDPEAMNILSILETDFVTICEKLVTGTLKSDDVKFLNKATVCKYAVPTGYPDHPVKNSIVDVSNVQDPEQLYFGAIDLRDNKLYAMGSRAAAVVGIADTVEEAERIAETEINTIKGDLFHRSDIGTMELIQQRVKHMQELRK